MLTAIFFSSSAVCAIVPATLFCINLRRYRPPPAVHGARSYSVSVLIPARNEEANIGAALRCVLASRDVTLEVLVLDDDSSDQTAEIARDIAAVDSRVRLISGGALPSGWNGKQHACWVLASKARSPLLAFLDADVRIEPELLSRMAAFRERTETALVSGFPRLVTVTRMERLLLPLIHFLLLGFLPMRAMRRSTAPSFAAGCGQFMLLERDAYFASGGHSAIRETMHDGLLLPRVLRRAGYRTDLADITELASVRMYDSAAKVWQGLAKNATEGIAAPGKIVPLSLMLVMGQVVPALVAIYIAVISALLLFFRFGGEVAWNFALHGSPTLVSLYITAQGGFLLNVPYASAALSLLAVFALSVLCVYGPRLLAVRRFRQPIGSALLHPLAIVVLLAIQWYALGRKVFGRPVGWRERSYSSGTGAQIG